MAVGLGGLALVVAARGTEGVRGADANDDGEATVVAGDPSSAGGASGLADVVSGQSIQLLDFGQIDQAGTACSNALPGDLPETIDVTGGESGSLDDEGLVQLVVDDAVVYGNLDDDAAEEAVVHTTCQYGANGQQDRVQVWDVESGTSTPKASTGEPPQDLTGRFPGTVQDVAVEDGEVLVTWSHFADDDPACCPSETATLRYEVDGNRLAQVGDPEIADIP
jgi:LppP/LprE lipoprotein